MRASHFSFCLALSLVLPWGCGGTAPTRVEPTTDQVARSSRGMVVAAQPLATAAGVEMLERGGNAADAAVAAAFAVSVVEPSMNSIGGRTQILVRTAEGSFHGIDATTQAPDTYDPDTAPQAGYGYPTVGLPGAVAGLTRLLDDHGTLPLATVMEPAIRYASEGFALLPGEAARQASAAEQLRESEGATLYYLKPDGSPYEAGDHFVQHDLAMVLRRIASGGAEAFYRGGIAQAMVDDIVDAGGHVTAAALAGYRAEDARVVRGSYRGHELVGTFTPAAGAMTIGILQIIENFDMAGADEATWAAVVGQALALGFEAARTHRGPDAWRLLTSREWAREQAERVRLPVAVAAMGREPTTAPWRFLEPKGAPWLPIEDVRPGPGDAGEASVSWLTADRAAIPSGAHPVATWLPGADDEGHTTHLSTADADGMAVALTQTIGPAMGSKVATPGLGFLYAATLGGYLGRLEPGERARSNISPFMVLDGGDPMLVLGAAGGARIVSAVVQAVCRVIDQGLSLPEALAAARLHPMQGSLNSPGSESGFQMETSPDIGWSPEVIAELRQMGFAVREVPGSGAFGRIHGMSWDATASSWTGAADPDWEGSAAAPRGGAPEFDVILRGGILQAAGDEPEFVADVALAGDRIAAMGDLSDHDARDILDIAGLHVAPGFIDVHSHAGSGLDTEDRSHAEPLLAQGITTVVVNPDGGGPVDLDLQRAVLLEDGLGVNVAQLVPHGSVRRAVLGMDDRLPGPDDMAQMKALVRVGMEEGAFGMSSGPFYAPGSYSDTDELAALAEVAAEYGGVYTSHIRDESDYTIGLVAAVEEVIAVARAAGLPGVVTHIKALGPPVWGKSAEVIATIEAARAEGVEVYADQYPYEASSTGLSAALLPRWAQAGGGDSLMARLAGPGTRARIREEMEANLARRGGADRLQFRRFRPDPSIEGRTLEDVAVARSLHPLDAALELIVEGGASVVSFNMNDDDIAAFMTRPWTMTASDGALPEWRVGVPHPRAYGTFARKLRKYVLEDGTMNLKAAIRSMTSLPADVFGLEGRGRLVTGAVADIVVFDLAEVRDLATYTDPHQLSRGMVHVFVNGAAAIRDGAFTGERAGRVLRR